MLIANKDQVKEDVKPSKNYSAIIPSLSLTRGYLERF